MDWLNVKISFEADGVGVDRDELRRCLQEGKKYVRLDDGSFAAFDPDKVRAMLDREVELLAAAGKDGKLPLSQAGRVQELLGQLEETNVSAKAKKLLGEVVERFAESEEARQAKSLLDKLGQD